MTSSNSFQVFKGGWDQLENGVFTDNQGPVDSLSFSFFIKPDGMRVFVLHTGLVEEHPLTIPWDVSSILPAVSTFSVNPQDTSATGIFFKDDGTKMFITGSNNKKLFEYNLSAWDVSTAVFNDVTLELSAIPVADTPTNCVFSTTGNIVFITTGVSVFSYILNNDWDAGSNTITPTDFTPAVPIKVDSIAFKPEGNKMYIGDISTTLVHEFDLSSPFIIVGAVDTGKILDVTNQTIDPRDIFWRSNGTQFFVLSTITNDITKYHLESQWDISTASFFKNDFVVGGNLQRDVFWRQDGLKMFELDSGTQLITSYDATTPFNTSTLTTGFTFNVGTQQPIAQGMWWSSDGLKLFVVGNVRIVFEYTTNVPYSLDPADISTTPTDSFVLVAANFSNPTGIFFSPDGKIMLISADNPEEIIHQFNLTAPYVLPPDLTVADGRLVLPVIDDVQPRDVFVKPDGLQMFIPTTGTDDIVRYVLTTPFGENPITFDIETAKLADRLDVGPAVLNPQGISLSPDGKRLFICDLNLKIISTCDLLLEFNNSIITNLGEDLITNTGDRLVYA